MNSKILCALITILFTLASYHTLLAHEKAKHKTPTKQEHWTAPPEAAKRLNPVPPDQGSIERGKILFQDKCSVCHGPGGKGDGPAAAGLKPKLPDLVKMSGHHPDGDIAWKIANGRGSMPAWKDALSENDIWDLTNFIQSLGKYSE
jgi:mono/diheme cytochrome c family protein